jgi:hypothetical protein
MVRNSNAIATNQFQIRAIPLKDVLSTVVLTKKNLRAEKSNLESRKVVPFIFQHSDVSIVVENLVAAFLVRDQLASNPIHSERNRQVNKGTSYKIGDAGTDTLGAARVHNEFEVVVVGQEVALGGLQNSPKARQSRELDGARFGHKSTGATVWAKITFECLVACEP